MLYAKRIDVSDHAYYAFLDRKDSNKQYRNRDIASLVAKKLYPAIRKGLKLNKEGHFFIQIPGEKVTAVMAVDSHSKHSQFRIITFLKIEWGRPAEDEEEIKKSTENIRRSRQGDTRREAEHRQKDN